MTLTNLDFFSHRNYKNSCFVLELLDFLNANQVLALSSIIQKIDFAEFEITHGSPIPYSLFTTYGVNSSDLLSTLTAKL